MNISTLAKLAAVFALTGALAGCMDVSTELDIQSETGGKATTSVTIGAEFYPMIKQMAEAAKASGSTRYGNRRLRPDLGFLPGRG